jgi:hypothetical protein
VEGVVPNRSTCCAHGRNSRLQNVKAKEDSPHKGEHQIRYYGWYSNKKRGVQEKKVAAPGQPEPDTTFRRKCSMTWAALIKCVYEACAELGRSVDPLKCPQGGEMRIISFIEEEAVIEKIVNSILKGMDTNPSGLTYCVFCLFCGTAVCGRIRRSVRRRKRSRRLR